MGLVEACVVVEERVRYMRRVEACGLRFCCAVAGALKASPEQRYCE